MKRSPILRRGLKRAPDRYGPVWDRVRRLPCWVAGAGYRGRGHPRCGMGETSRHTAHHIGRRDSDGLIPVCGAAHDLFHNRAGRRAAREFDRWLADHNVVAIAVGYVTDNPDQDIPE